MKRLVLDTNVVIAALVWDGTPRRVLNAGYGGNAAFITSAALLTERLEPIFHVRNSNGGYTRLDKQSIRSSRPIAGKTTSVIPFPVPRIVSDPDDDVVIGTALAANAHCIVTAHLRDHFWRRRVRESATRRTMRTIWHQDQNQGAALDCGVPGYKLCGSFQPSIRYACWKKARSHPATSRGS